MARNEEKAMSTLSRWRAMQAAEEKGVATIRPYHTSECEDVRQAERWRNQIIGEVGRLVTQIQNSTLNEHKIRDLNDGINKLLREKISWEFRIKELGGADYMASGVSMFDKDGVHIPGIQGYRYFGAARNLPGVRELFEEKAKVIVRQTRAELEKHIDAEYYGYCDKEEEEAMVAEEVILEKKVLEAYMDEYAIKMQLSTAKKSSAGPFDHSNSDDNNTYQDSSKFMHENMISQDDIERIILDNRKKELLDRYLGSLND